MVNIHKVTDIFPEYRDTPAGRLLEYQNLRRPLDTFDHAELLIGMCMDNRNRLRIPDNFAFIIRTGGANMQYSEFMVSFAISVGSVGHMALIGHSDCGMANLSSRRDQFIEGLSQTAGWTRDRAEEHFRQYAPVFEIRNELDFILSETVRLRANYPSILVVPMIYRVEDHRLYLVRE